ncbi:hypothetical protein GCM10023188_48350 [Pontibacter saemangeumensis]|uniref:Protein SCO1/2 n=1 Tax=Pontibacter saemangeumensis TaxID=1084525 RepID=A0ABP8M6M8_9BACT
MKRYLTIPILLSLALTACTSDESPSSAPPETAAHAAHLTAGGAAGPESLGTVTDMSLYNLESDWKTQAGESIRLVNLKGKVQIVAMVYTSCTYACPRIVADLKRIETSLEKVKRQDVGIVLVTMDPANDTPAQLKTFAAANKLEADRWVLLTGEDAAIQELAVLLNMKYKKAPNGDIAHSNIISVLNANGEIIHQQEGLGVEPDETVKAIEGLLL